MKRWTSRAVLVGTIVLPLLLAACRGAPDISIDGRSITLHATGAPTATITSQGSFSIGTKVVETSPDQRRLLARYYHDVSSIHDDAQHLRKAGVDLAGKALQQAGHAVGKSVGLVSASSTSGQTRTRAVENAGQAIQHEGQHLCDEIHQTRTLQSALASRIPAFKPYAQLDPAPGAQCHGDVLVVL